MAVQFKIANEREFSHALRSYLKQTRRDLADVLNKKSYFIVRRAIWYTHKADRAKMIRELGAHEVSELQKTATGELSRYKRGKNAGQLRRRRTFEFGEQGSLLNSRVGKILIAKLRKTNQPIPATKVLQRMAERFFQARLRSIAFLKSGWITARDGFKRAIRGGGFGLPPNDRDAKQYGRAKGDYRRASPGFRPVAMMINRAIAKGDKKNALHRFGQPALQRAFNEEIASMKDFVLNRELKASARRQGIKVG